MKKYIIILLMLISSVIQATNYYISPTGNDSNTGLSDAQAWLTITKVNAFTTFASGDKILFKRGGTWYGTIIPRYSEADLLVTYGAYGTGEKPIITGFTSINSGWTDEGGGIYSKVITSEAQTNMVLIDGKQYAMGRTPNKGSWNTYESFSTTVSITDNQLSASPSWTGAEAVIYKNGWEIDRTSITNHSGTTITYTNLGGTNAPTLSSSEGKYFFQNSLQTLDSYGEWYHDYSGTGKLYVYFGGVDPTTKPVNVATLNRLFYTNNGRDNINIRDLEFTGSIKDAIDLYFSNDDLDISATSVSFSGLSGIRTQGVDVVVDSCTVNNINAIGIVLFGTGGIVSNNSISDIALPEGQGSLGTFHRGGIYLYEVDKTVQYNTIDSTGFTGIGTHSTFTSGLVKNNYITNTCKWRNDIASFYCSSVATSIVVEENVIIGSGGSGIYLDQGSSGITVRNNSVSGCIVEGIKLHGTKNDTVTGNTVFDCAKGIRVSCWESTSFTLNLTITGNISVSKTATQIPFEYHTRYTVPTTEIASHTFDNNYYARPIDDNTTIQTNILAEGIINRTLAGWKTYSSKDDNSNGSPKSVTSESDVELRYNETNIAKLVSFSWAGVDMEGTQKPSTMTLQPYISLILIKNIVNTGGSNKMATSGGKPLVDRNGNPLYIE